MSNSNQAIGGNLKAAYDDYYAIMNNEFDPNATSQTETYQYPADTNEEFYGEESEEPHQNKNLSTSQHSSKNSSESSGSINSASQTQNDSEINNSIYISGLPSETTVQDLKQHFGSIGVIKSDKRTKEMKITIYRDRDTNEPKGDAILSYDDIEAAKAAIQWFNDKEFLGKKIHVEYAQRKIIPQKQQGKSYNNNNNNNNSNIEDSIETPEGDWECPSCGNLNWPRRLSCNRCKTAKPETSNQSHSESQRIKKPPRTQSTDWACEGCGNINWGWRTSCNRCFKNRSGSQDEEGEIEEKKTDKRERETSGRERYDRKGRDFYQDKGERERKDHKEDRRERDKDDRRERERDRDRDDRRRDSHKDSARDRNSDERRDRRERPY